MKILQVCPRYPPDIGGVEEHVRNISERLARKYDVTVFTTDPTGKFQKKEIINSVKIRRFKSWAPSESYYFSRELKECLMKNSESFDIVHTHSYRARYMHVISPLLFIVAMFVGVIAFVFYFPVLWFLIPLALPLLVFRKPKSFIISYLISNLALVIGLMRHLTGRKEATWRKIEEMRIS